ncbi:hypothetical protein GAY33_14705 [Azospirillum brasilense]|uniref:hypothetical protein n=1 Tax=Azospirillum argentinense TaxID=2970906 RepID=UPI00190C9ADF|nr:hypothetical protein [Azospirillum argentinense]MBK3800469.1 hypothetical protein [Azospirillum argentinense]
MQQPADNTAIAVSLTAPGWAPVLTNVNTALTTISLLLGIAFIVWRWSRQVHHDSREDSL